MNIRHAIIAIVMAALICASIYRSAPYVDSGTYAQTAHTLSSMRAFQDWGFWTLRGTSVLLPKSREFTGINPRTFTGKVYESIYVSYPSGWLVLPYAAFVTAHAVVPSLEISSAFLMGYNVLLDRLLTGILLLFFLCHVLQLIAAGRLTPMQRDIIALTGCAMWFLSAPVLYWTQNAYGMDETIPVFITAMLIIIARRRCRLDECTPRERFLLMFLSFIECSVDWYGWVAIGLMAGCCILYQLATRQYVSHKALILSYGAIAAGGVAAGGVFLLQLMSFPEGLNQLGKKYAIRSAVPPLTTDVLRSYAQWWTSYLPLPYGWAGILFLLASPAAAVCLLRRMPADAGAGITLLLSLCLPPVVWTLLLPQHSVEHPFSLLKFALPSFTMTCLLMAWGVMAVHSRLSLSQRYVTGLFAALFLLACVIINSTHHYRAMEDHDDPWGRDIRALLDATVDRDDIALSHSRLLIGSRPPHKLWYANRWIYPPYVLESLVQRGLVNTRELALMHPVYFHSSNMPVPPAIATLCGEQWEKPGLRVNGIEMLVCRSDGFRRLYGIK